MIRVRDRGGLDVTGRLAFAPTPGSFTGTLAALAAPDVVGRVPFGRVVATADAEVAVFPFNVPTAVVGEEDRLAFCRLVRDNAAHGLRTVAMVAHDHTRPVDIGQPDAVVLRTSMLASTTYVGEHAMPVFVHDPWSGEVVWREWRTLPVLGFMGRAASDGGRSQSLSPEAVHAGFHVIDAPAAAGARVFSVPIDIGGVLRVKALAGLRGSTLVDPAVVVRDRFYGHYSDDERRAMRAEYARHLAASDYVLCARGYGNFSIRLFETLAMGRVPVLLESDLVLPCADVVDWDGLAVRVPLADIDRVDEHVAAAHAEGPERFAWRQRAAREAWGRWLSVDGFAGYVASHILRMRPA